MADYGYSRLSGGRLWHRAQTILPTRAGERACTSRGLRNEENILHPADLYP